MFIPVIRILTECPIPYTITPPRIPNPNKFEILFGELPHIQNTVVMVFEDALWTLVGSLSRFLGIEIGAPNMELLGEVTQQ